MGNSLVNVPLLTKYNKLATGKIYDMKTNGNWNAARDRKRPTQASE